jgi:hypothetical protein
VNPEPGEEPISLEDVGLYGPQVRIGRGCAVKTFSQGIQNEPKETWCLMFDEGGTRHGVRTTNFAEVYNFVLRGSRPLSLVGIIEFFMYRTIKYFYQMSKLADEILRNTQMVYCTKMTEYLDKAQGKALLHKVTTQPLYQFAENEIMQRYKVECKGKTHLGPSREKAQQVAELGNKICRCSCRKPQLLHIPCSHVIGLCYELQQFNYRRHMPWYYDRKLLRTLGTEQFRTTSCMVLLLRTPRKCCAHTKSRS